MTMVQLPGAMIGSTANIVALGMLEKHGGSQITFFQWFKIGLLCTIVSGAIAVGSLLALSPFMADHKITFNKLAAESGYVPTSAEFDGELNGELKAEDSKTYLIGAKGEKIAVVLPADAKVTSGKVRISGTFAKDDANKAYPYMLKAKKVESVKKD